MDISGIEPSPLSDDFSAFEDVERRISALREAFPWPKSPLAARADRLSRRRDELVCLGCERLLERHMDDQRWLILHWRATRGIVTRVLASKVWNAVVVAVGHWNDAINTDYPPGVRRGDTPAAGLFFDDCRRFRDRIVPMRRTPAQSLDELASLSLSPQMIFTTARSGTELAEDLALWTERVPDAPLMGTGWLRGPVGEMARDFARRNVVELDALDDAWSMWRESDCWLAG